MAATEIFDLTKVFKDVKASESFSTHAKKLLDSGTDPALLKQLINFRRQYQVIPNPITPEGIKFRCDFLEVIKNCLRILIADKFPNEELEGMWTIIDYFKAVFNDIDTTNNFFEICLAYKLEAKHLNELLRTEPLFNQGFLMSLIGVTEFERDILASRTLSGLASHLEVFEMRQVLQNANKFEEM